MSAGAAGRAATFAAEFADDGLVRAADALERHTTAARTAIGRRHG
ncbi:hypothetical protein ACWEKT_19900 [Nocardia takedensis]|nr:hypothetical protein [Nocardia takedensis]